MIEVRFFVERKGIVPFSLSVDLRLPTKGVTAIFGPSGSGKTTLLRMIAGLERVRDGYLSIGGTVWQEGGRFVPTHRRELGYVFQEASLFPHLRVRDNLEYGARRVGVVDKKSVEETAILLGIEHLMERFPDKLSGGERQRVAIGRALLTRPKILLMDEPLASLDQARKAEVLPYLQELHRKGEIPILYVSHNADEVAQLADHLVVMESGRVKASGAIGDTLAQTDLPIYLGEDVSVVREGKIVLRDRKWSLAWVEFAGGGIWIRDLGQSEGKSVRMRILARDVSINLEKPIDSSALNHLACEVVEWGEDLHPALCIVKLKLGDGFILSRMTRRSAEQLGLSNGKRVWAQIKAVAVLG